MIEVYGEVIETFKIVPYNIIAAGVSCNVDGCLLSWVLFLYEYSDVQTSNFDIGPFYHY